MNDRVSSIRTFGRSEVVVYRDEAFGGGSVRFDGDVPDLRQANWNDRISSVEVRGSSYGYRGGYSDRYGYRGSYSDRSARGANQIVRRAYRDVLGRDPDERGMQYYRGRIVDDGWTEARVRQDLRHSNEYKTQTSDVSDRYGETSRYGMTRARAQNIVRGAYRSVLDREPDPASEGYVEHVLRDGWSQIDVERDLRRSDEYRNRIR
jgi:hypothetical protein